MLVPDIHIKLGRAAGAVQKLCSTYMSRGILSKFSFVIHNLVLFTRNQSSITILLDKIFTSALFETMEKTTVPNSKRKENSRKENPMARLVHHGRKPNDF